MAHLLVIFDCDGVLVDSEPIAARASAQALTRMGWPVSPEEVLERFLGCTDEYFEAEVTAHLGTWSADDWRQQVDPVFDEMLEHELQPVDGVVDLLDELAERRVETCVASNGGHSKMRRTLGLTGLASRFEGRVFSADDVPRGKPHPDLFLHAAAQMGASPVHCVVVEDSPRGVEAACAAGMRCIGYAGRTPAAVLQRCGVEVVDSMDAVAEYIRLLRRESG